MCAKKQGRPLQTTLADYLREKTLLLVLDNCEHVIDASSHLAGTLLQRCPGLRILASSREALGVEGEFVMRVPSLSLPPTGPASQETLEGSEAVRLFVSRAATALPGFELTDANAAAVAQVCRRLDGVALALELAAARVKALRVEQIAARLDDAFHLLTGGSRTALPRQQTLRATMDWSHALLSDAERACFRRLAVFAGGWTLEAAEAVCAGAGWKRVMCWTCWPIREQVAGGHRPGARAGGAVPPAGNDPAVCLGEAAASRRAGAKPHSAPGVLLRAGASS